MLKVELDISILWLLTTLKTILQGNFNYNYEVESTNSNGYFPSFCYKDMLGHMTETDLLGK